MTVIIYIKSDRCHKWHNAWTDTAIDEEIKESLKEEYGFNRIAEYTLWTDKVRNTAEFCDKIQLDDELVFAEDVLDPIANCLNFSHTQSRDEYEYIFNPDFELKNSIIYL